MALAIGPSDERWSDALWTGLDGRVDADRVPPKVDSGASHFDRVTEGATKESIARQIVAAIDDALVHWKPSRYVQGTLYRTLALFKACSDAADRIAEVDPALAGAIRRASQEATDYGEPPAPVGVWNTMMRVLFPLEPGPEMRLEGEQKMEQALADARKIHADRLERAGQPASPAVQLWKLTRALKQEVDRAPLDHSGKSLVQTLSNSALRHAERLEATEPEASRALRRAVARVADQKPNLASQELILSMRQVIDDLDARIEALSAK